MTQVSLYWTTGRKTTCNVSHVNWELDVILNPRCDFGTDSRLRVKLWLFHTVVYVEYTTVFPAPSLCSHSNLRAL